MPVEEIDIVQSQKCSQVKHLSLKLFICNKKLNICGKIWILIGRRHFNDVLLGLGADLDLIRHETNPQCELQLLLLQEIIE